MADRVMPMNKNTYGTYLVTVYRYSSSTQILHARLPGRQNFLRWRLTFLVHNRELVLRYLLPPRLLRWLLGCWRICAPVAIGYLHI
jgi:hypothetical protein